MGLMPHNSPPRVFASEVYKKEFVQWEDRLGVSDLSFKTFLPHLSLPKVLSNLGYESIARVSMPVLNNYTLLSRDFDDYRLMEDHNDFKGMVEEVTFEARGKPRFYFLNLGETHYPYMLSGDELPHISGVHGVFKQLAASHSNDGGEGDRITDFFDDAVMNALHAQQVKCVEYVDGLIGDLLTKCPSNTHIIVTADHGELFGEGGYFGHGPIMHEKCFEIPFLEGGVPR